MTFILLHNQAHIYKVLHCQMSVRLEKKAGKKLKKKHFTCETCGDFQLILTQMFALIFFMTHSMAVKASERRGDYQQVRKTE